MAKTASEEKKVKGNDPVTIEWTAKCKFHKAGTKSTIHKEQADKFVKSGKAKLVKES